MYDYKKMVLIEVLKHPMFKDAIKNLPRDQVEIVENQLTEFVESFGTTVLSTFAKVANNKEYSEEIQKGFENLDENVIIDSAVRVTGSLSK
jgi:hypothetical protein